ncbi:hypothetical protein ACFVVX_09925 [Kitasatospora sp. NPDC058170]|uniref:hypothetical protein n=1 Tax=Kitasatospora sp. NPDC058170 TaxID=3346364 RepID=UPI0036DD9098
MDDEKITITLTPDEALVLSDWFHRLQMTELGRVVDDPAVWVPVQRIAGTLDGTLTAVFAPDYVDRLAAARARLRTELGDPREI